MLITSNKNDNISNHLCVRIKEYLDNFDIQMTNIKFELFLGNELFVIG